MDMKRSALIMAGVGLLAVAGSASAVPTTVTDTVTFSADGASPSGALVDSGIGNVNPIQPPQSGDTAPVFDFISWIHHYTPPAGMSVLGGTLTLTFSDDEQDVPGDPQTGAGGDPSTLEVASVEHNDTFLSDGFGPELQPFGEIDSGQYQFQLDPSMLSGDSFGVTVTSHNGDFSLDQSSLSVNYAANAVPEPTTVLLLGGGLAGMGFAGRRRRKA